MSNKKSGGSEKHGYQPSKEDSSGKQGGYTPIPIGERNPAPPPKAP